MNLLGEIIDTLSDESKPLTTAFLKVKVITHRLGAQAIASWVDDEINGYKAEKDAPPYRKVSATLHGHLQTIATIEYDRSLPESCLPGGWQRHLRDSALTASIASLEQLSEGKGSLKLGIPPELYEKMGEALSSGYWIREAWLQIEPSQVRGVLTQIRNRLLAFALDLAGQVGDAESAEAANVKP